MKQIEPSITWELNPVGAGNIDIATLPTVLRERNFQRFNEKDPKWKTVNFPPLPYIIMYIYTHIYIQYRVYDLSK